MVNDDTPSQHAQLQEVARRLLELDVSDPELRNKIIGLKSRSTKALNTRVGNPHIDKALKKGIAARQASAKAFAESMRGELQAARAAGHTGFADIARYLNSKGLKTSKGGEWLRTSVMRLIEELKTNQ